MAGYRRRRSSGVKRTGALIINGRRRRTVRRKATRRKATRRRATRRTTARSRGRTRSNGYRRAGSLRIKTNGRSRARRKAPRIIYRTRTNGSFGFTLPGTQGIAKAVRKVPLVGKPLAQALQLGGPAALGALSVIPTTLLAQTVGPFVPNMNSSLFYALTGLGFAGIIGSTKFLGAGFHRALAIAVAAGSGAIAVYKWQTGTDAPMATETGRLLVNSPLAGLGTLIVGGRKLSGYGPSAVRPMHSGYHVPRTY